MMVDAASYKLAAIEHVGGERDLKDLLLGGIHLAVAGITGQIGRQIAARRVDGRLHIARRGVDVAIQFELQRNAGASQRAGGGHLGNRGNTSKLALQRRRHRGRHGLRACAGQVCLHVKPAQLLADGVIQSNAFSLWLNDLDASTGSILFGGIDTEKFEGTLATLPIQKESGYYAEFLITLTGVSLGNTVIASNQAQAVIIGLG